MIDDMARATCQRNSWWVALLGGVLVAAMLAFVAQHGFLRSVLIGAVVAVLLGLFLVWAFCSSADRATHQAAPARPEPDAAPVPRPAAEPARPAVTEPAAAARAVPEAVVPPASPERVAEPVAVATAAPVMAAGPTPKPARPAARKTAKPAAAKPAKAATAAAPAKPKAKAGTALDAALAKSREPVAKAGPELLTAPRGGKADDLKMIKGVGPKLEKLLNDVGVWHFDQIAGWKAKDIAFVDDRMEGFKGRITRDEWVKQAKLLAKGGATEFSERVARGGVYRGAE